VRSMILGEKPVIENTGMNRCAASTPAHEPALPSP
jgi:hypothetical protein